jgi:hypothetical protein
MGNQDSSAVWKVNGEEKYFKRVSDTKWVEYDNGRHVFDFDFLSYDGDAVYLKKCGWLMWLRLDSDRIIYGESLDKLDKHLYWGGWQSSTGAGSQEVKRYKTRSPSPQPEGNLFDFK